MTTTVRREDVRLDGICRVTVTGTLGIGSAGNGQAGEILDAVRDARAQPGCRRVLLDLSQLVYEYGNSIGAVFYEERVDVILNPDCAKAWNGLLSMVDPRWPRVLGGRVRFAPR